MRRTIKIALCATALACAGAQSAATASATGNPMTGWGENGSGQVGDGTTVDKRVPVAAGPASGVVAVAAGGDHTLALMSNGTVQAWGSNSHGQLGNGTTTSSTTPVEVKELSGVTAIAASSEYSMALLESGKVMTWGSNADGQLGNGSTTSSDVPVEVKELTNVTAIAAAPNHALAVRKEGSEGLVVDWGTNEFGSLGNGSYSGKSTVPVSVSGITNAVAVSGGSAFSVALLSNGKAESWGTNQLGQLGTGNKNGPSKCAVEFGFKKESYEFGCSSTPVAVSGLVEADAVASGGAYTLVLLSGGTVEAWGENELGQLGTGSASGPDECVYYNESEPGFAIPFPDPCAEAPVPVVALSGVTQVAAGGAHSTALLSSGTIESWGTGQLGTGTSGTAYSPQGVAGVGEVVSIAAGGGNGFAVGPLPPTVTGVTQAGGPVSGGASVKITGTHFYGVTAVKFGGAASSAFTVESETSITATSPSRKPGVVDVTVVTPHGTSASNGADRYTYEPEALGFGRCRNVGSGAGKYKSGACTEPLEGGKYEWSPGVVKAGVSFADGTETVEKVVKPKKVLFESTGKTQLTCTNLAGSGEFFGTTALAGVTIKFLGCELGGSKCSSVGAAEGEVATQALTGTLGWREKSGNLAGLALAPAAEEGAFLEATCGSSTVKVSGSAIGTITPLNNMNATFTITFKQSKGKQSIERFEGEAAQELRMSVSGGSSVQTGLSMQTVQTNEEEVEINTVA